MQIRWCRIILIHFAVSKNIVEDELGEKKMGLIKEQATTPDLIHSHGHHIVFHKKFMPRAKLKAGIARHEIQISCFMEKLKNLETHKNQTKMANN